MNMPKESTDSNLRQATFQGLEYFGKPLQECNRDELIAAVYVNCDARWLKRPKEYLHDDGDISIRHYSEDSKKDLL